MNGCIEYVSSIVVRRRPRRAITDQEGPLDTCSSMGMGFLRGRIVRLADFGRVSFGGRGGFERLGEEV